MDIYKKPSQRLATQKSSTYKRIEKTRKTSKDSEDLLNYWLPQTMTIPIPNAPHMIQITNPKEVVQTINSFLCNVNRF